MALTSGSLSAILQSASVSWRGALQMSGTLVLTPASTLILSAAFGIPRDCLTLIARRAYVPRSYGTVAIGEAGLGRLPLPRALYRHRLRHTSQSFCEGGLFVFVLWLEFCTHPVACRPALQEHRLWIPSWHYPSSFLWLTSISKK